MRFLFINYESQRYNKSRACRFLFYYDNNEMNNVAADESVTFISNNVENLVLFVNKI
jgi:hypothetical protein